MIKKGKEIPDSDHVMRHVPWKRLLRDGNDRITGFLPQAFEPREIDDGALSVTWIEYFSAEKSDGIRGAAAAIRQSRNVGQRGAFGIANVQKIRGACVRSSGAKIRVVYHPTKANVAHAQIRRIPRDDLMLLDSLARDAFTELIMNSAVR